MDSSNIELPDSEIAAITIQGTVLRVSFCRAYIIKTMTGSTERTRWWQAGDLVFDSAVVQGELPTGMLICAGGDIRENLYTYRDMIPIPLNAQGQISCLLRFKDSTQILQAKAQRVQLQLEAVAKYIEHIRH